MMSLSVLFLVVFLSSMCLSVQFNMIYLTPGNPVKCCVDGSTYCLAVYNPCSQLMSTNGNISFTNFTYVVYQVFQVPNNQPIQANMNYQQEGYVAFPNAYSILELDVNAFPAILLGNISEPKCLPVGCDDDFPESLNYTQYVGFSPDCTCQYPWEQFEYFMVGRDEFVLHLANPAPIFNSTYSVAEVLANPYSKYGFGQLNDVGEFFNSIGDDYADIQINIPSRRRAGPPDSTVPCTISYIIDYPKSNNLTIFNRSPPTTTWVVAIRYNSYYNLLDCNSFICSVSLPVDTFYTQGYLYIDVENLPPNICASFVVYIPGESRCAPADCVLTCLPTAVKYYSCQPKEVQIQLWLMLVALIVVAVYFWWVWVLFAYHTVKFCIKLPNGAYIVIKAVVCSPMLSWLGGKMRTGSYLLVKSIGLVDAKNAIWNGEPGESKVELGAVTPQEVLVNHSRGAGGGKLGVGYGLFIVACLIPLTRADFLTWDQLASATIPPFAQCGFTSVVTGTTTSCQTLTQPDSGLPYEQCQTIFNAQLPAVGLGKVVCLDIQKDGIFAGKFYIEFSAMIATATLTSEYYTSDWETELIESSYCSNTHCCNSGPCGDYNTGKTPASGPTDNNGKSCNWIPDAGALNYKGIQSCTIRSPKTNKGNIFAAECCNGFSCHDGVCMIGFMPVKPVGKVYQVFSINAITYTPVLNVFFVDGAFTSAFSETLIISAGVAQSSNGYSFQLNGNYQNPSTTLFGNNYAVLDLANGTMFLSPAAPFGTPTTGMFGDIQFFEPSLPKGMQYNLGPYGRPTTTNQPYNFAHDMVSITGTTSLKAGTGARHGVATFATAGYALPKRVGLDMWSYDGTQLASNLTAAGAASLSIITTGPGVTVSVYTPRVCPDIDVINATGCYNCLDGAVMNIQLTTRCDSGWVTIRTDHAGIQMGTTSIFLAVGELITWLIPFITHEAVNDFTVTICDELGNNCDKDDVSFIAFEYTRNDTNFNQGNYTEEYRSASDSGLSDPKSAKSFFQRWISDIWYDMFNGLSTPLQTFIFFVELLLFLTLGYYIIKGLWNLEKNVHMERMKDDMSSYKSWVYKKMGWRMTESKEHSG